MHCDAWVVLSLNPSCVTHTSSERCGEVGGPPRHSVHGQGQSNQAFVTDGLHPIRAAAPVHRAGKPLPLLGGKSLDKRQQRRSKRRRNCSFIVSPSAVSEAILCTFSQLHIIHPVRKALDYYTEMEKALERESQNWAQSENAAKAKETKEVKETATGAQSSADGQADAPARASKPDQ